MYIRQGKDKFLFGKTSFWDGLHRWDFSANQCHDISDLATVNMERANMERANMERANMEREWEIL